MQDSEIDWRFLSRLPLVVSRSTPESLGLGITVRIGYRSTAPRMGGLGRFRLETDLSVTEEIVVAMPNLETLYLMRPVVTHGFLLPDPRGPNLHKKLLPSLRRLYLQDAKAVDDDWEPLVTYLAHQTSGNQAVSLDLFGKGVHVCPEVIEQIEGLVEELVYEPDRDQECPFDRCSLAK